MKDEWSKHRFSGGALALDLVNTVLRRADPARAADRLTDVSEANRFAEAAASFRQDELGDGFIFSCAQESDLGRLKDLRERIHAYFSPVPDNPVSGLAALSQLFGASERGLVQSGPDSLLCQIVFSWMRLNGADKRARLRACPACDWLFIDKSRNGSRIWCDMAVCGNRHKSKLSYGRKRRLAGQGAKAA